MQYTQTIDFTDGVSGYVQKVSSLLPSYTIGTGSGNCVVRNYRGNLLGVLDRRAIFHFDTGQIPLSAVIDVVEFFVKLSTGQGADYPIGMGIKIGSWIGASLDANDADYSGGNDLGFNIDDGFSAGDGSWIDLSSGGVDPTQYVAKEGLTDICIYTNLWNDLVDRTRSFNTAKIKCQLRITYRIPHVSHSLRLHQTKTKKVGIWTGG
jgi:hypothetical protein